MRTQGLLHGSFPDCASLGLGQPESRCTYNRVVPATLLRVQVHPLRRPQRHPPPIDPRPEIVVCSTRETPSALRTLVSDASSSSRAIYAVNARIVSSEITILSLSNHSQWASLSGIKGACSTNMPHGRTNAWKTPLGHPLYFEACTLYMISRH